MPSLGLMTLNVNGTCDSVLIPATSEYLSAKGLELLLKTIFKIKVRNWCRLGKDKVKKVQPFMEDEVMSLKEKALDMYYKSLEKEKPVA